MLISLTLTSGTAVPQASTSVVSVVSVKIIGGKKWQHRTIIIQIPAAFFLTPIETKKPCFLWFPWQTAVAQAFPTVRDTARGGGATLVPWRKQV
jgi:hypothetical protein